MKKEIFSKVYVALDTRLQRWFGKSRYLLYAGVAMQVVGG